MKFENFIKFLKPFFWRFIFAILGLVAAILFLVLGFGRTILILLCCTLGYFIGALHDKNINIVERLQYWRNRW